MRVYLHNEGLQGALWSSKEAHTKKLNTEREARKKNAYKKDQSHNMLMIIMEQRFCQLHGFMMGAIWASHKNDVVSEL